MAHATVTQSGGVCTITLPSNASNMVLIPNTSGNAQWINNCLWQGQDARNTKTLGEWSAQRKNLNIVSNPYNLINVTTKIATVTKDTKPVTITGIEKISLTFTHKKNASAPAQPNKLRVITRTLGDDVTKILISSEDTGDHNHKDFEMAITVTDN